MKELKNMLQFIIVCDGRYRGLYAHNSLDLCRRNIMSPHNLKRKGCDNLAYYYG